MIHVKKCGAKTFEIVRFAVSHFWAVFVLCSGKNEKVCSSLGNRPKVVLISLNERVPDMGPT